MGKEYKGMPDFEKNHFWNNTYQAVHVIIVRLGRECQLALCGVVQRRERRNCTIQE